MVSYRLAPDGTVEVHAWRSDDGHWSASFDGNPDVAFEGNTALVAAKMLVRSAAGLDETTLRLAYDDGRMAGLIVRRSGGGACPECGGTGRYVGLSIVEKCRACCGAGRS